MLDLYVRNTYQDWKCTVNMTIEWIDALPNWEPCFADVQIPFYHFHHCIGGVGLWKSYELLQSSCLIV